MVVPKCYRWCIGKVNNIFHGHCFKKFYQRYRYREASKTTYTLLIAGVHVPNTAVDNSTVWGEANNTRLQNFAQFVFIIIMFVVYFDLLISKMT